jgi:hypothetical protein
MAPGVAIGLWLARELDADDVASWVVVPCGMATMLAARAGWWLLRRLVRGPQQSSPPRMLRSRIGDDTALVTPPVGQGMPPTIAPATIGLALAAFLTSMLVRHDSVPDRSEIILPLLALPLALLAMSVFSPMGWLRGPTVALFANRIEIRRPLGHYTIRWQDAFLAAVKDGRPMIYLKSPSAALRSGLAGRPPAHGISIGSGLTVPAPVVVESVEMLRNDPAVRREVTQPMPVFPD